MVTPPKIPPETSCLERVWVARKPKRHSMFSGPIPALTEQESNTRFRRS
jgi:hypothetical protein